MVTVHMVGNAHLDPVWLWRGAAGMAETLATCRTACDLLDEHPDFVFTKGDSWAYELAARSDPGLWGRIRAHARSGRWAVVGGWYVQPDCNFPLEESLRTHIRLGKEQARRDFGVDVTVGYNVDSFGHAAFLPRILREGGYDAYVMMRPMAHEKALPAPLFRWRSPDGAEVLAWRIPKSYTEKNADLSGQIRAALEAADASTGHVLCFYGVGDHGGGPTGDQIRWIRAHADSLPGARLVFSHPRAFFDAVKPAWPRLPVVEGELQFHSIGCYSVERSVKRNARRAEHGLIGAEAVLDAFPAAAGPADRALLDGAWRKLLFNQFHDIYGGTCIPEAYRDARDQLGAARDAADSVIQGAALRVAGALPADRLQRILALNPSNAPFRGLVAHEPWTDWEEFRGSLIDEAGHPVPFQILPAASVTGRFGRLLWPMEAAAGGLRAFRLLPEAPPAQATDLAVEGTSVANGSWRLEAGREDCLLRIAGPSGADGVFAAEGLSVQVREDLSDTWSHGLDRYAGRILGRFHLQDSSVVEAGPLRAALRIRAAYGASRLTLKALLAAGDPGIEVRLRIDWRERHAVAHLSVAFLREIVRRMDGVPGGFASRPHDGTELPVVDALRLDLSGGRRFGIALPDCGAVSGEGSAVALTLLRSPVYAWHDPAKLTQGGEYRYTDQGEHEFRFLLAQDAEEEALRRAALGFHRPPLCIDWTRGMR